MGLPMPLLNALSLKGTITQLHLGMLCVKLLITITHSQVRLADRHQQNVFQPPTCQITLSLYQIRPTHLKYLLMNMLLLSCMETYILREYLYAHLMIRCVTQKNIIGADGVKQVVTNAVLDKVWTSGYVDLHPIRNLYLISHTLGT